MSSSAFTPAVLTVSSGAGSGSGEKNYITNPSMASATTGWNVVGDFTLTRTTAASELPREYTTGTGIKLVATSAGQGTDDYIYFDFNLDDVDLNRKLKIQWSQKDIGTYQAGQLAVIITSQANRTTALHTPVTTAIPAVDGDFVTSFDSGSTAALSLVIRATTDMTTGDGIVLSDVIVGPGEIVQGAVVSEWQSFTPSYNNIGTATFSNNIGWMRRVGSNLEISVSSKVNAAGSGSTQITLNLPNNLTVNWSAIAQVSGSGQPLAILGYGSYISTAYLHISVFARQDIGIVFGLEGSTANNITGADLVAGRNFDFTASIPVSEWASNGTINLGPGAQVEYIAYDDTTATTASTDYTNTAKYTTSPAGAQLQNVSIATTDADTSYLLTWQYPAQADDLIILEYSSNSGATWESMSDYYPRIHQNLYRFGTRLDIVSTTQVRVRFGNRGASAEGTAFATGSGSAWNSTASSALRWRVRKSKASAPVGFGVASTDGTAGLYKAGQAPGLTTGAAISAGYIGEVIRANSGPASVPTSAQYGDGSSITLTAGTWRIDAAYFIDRNGATLTTATTFAHGVSVTSGNSSTGLVRAINEVLIGLAGSTTSNLISVVPISFTVRCDGTTITRIDDATAFGAGLTLYHKIYVDNYSTATPQYRDKITATRIA